MTLHKGKIYKKDSVSIQEPDLELMKDLDKVKDPELNWGKWRNAALTDNKIYYFGIYEKERLIGAIFLHDIDLNKKESLIGYHLFKPEDRGRGVGTIALQLLQQYVKEDTSLKKLIIITHEDNVASRAIATKRGFSCTGSSWEDPHKVVYEWLRP